MKLVTKATATRRAVFTTGLISVLLFSGVGYYLINRSSAAITATSVCGSGYNVVKTNYTGYGRIYILQNTNVKKFCAVYMATGSAYGVSKTMKVQAYLNHYSGTGVASYTQNSGSFKYYAGPVYVRYGGVSKSVWPTITAKGNMTYKNQNWPINITYVR